MQAEEQVEFARRSGKGYKEVMAAAQRAATARAALSKFEQDALAADPDASAAKQNLIDANSHVRELVVQFEAGITADPDWRAARARLDAARNVRVARP